VLEAPHLQLSDLRERSDANTRVSAEPQEERKTMTVPQPRPRLRKPLDAQIICSALDRWPCEPRCGSQVLQNSALATGLPENGVLLSTGDLCRGWHSG